MLPLRGFVWSRCIAGLFLVGLSCNAPAVAQDKRLAAVTSSGIPEKERDRYFEVLKDFSSRKIQAFLTKLGLRVEDVQKEMGTVDLNILGAGNCLAKYTVAAIYSALQDGCALRPDDAFIFSIILPKFAEDNMSVVTNFFPYGIDWLKSTPNSPSNTIEYVEGYPNAGARDWTEALIVVSFLNRYWENVKSKPALTENEFAIVYKGFGQYQGKLTKLCQQIADAASRDSCKVIAGDAEKKSIQASQRPLQ